MAFPNVNPDTIIAMPQSQIVLYVGVPFDPGYNHTVAFTDSMAQSAYFDGLTKRRFQNTQYIRHTAGALKLSASMAEISTCNYMSFHNYAPSPTTGANYAETKTYYAFIDSIEYVSVNTCIINYSIDLMQTYMFDYTLGNCFIERIHVKDDIPGRHTLDEGLPTGERMRYTQIDGVQNCPFTAGKYYNAIFWADGDVTTSATPVMNNVLNGISVFGRSAPNEIFSKLAQLNKDGKSDQVVGVVQVPEVFVVGEGPQIFTAGFTTNKYSTRIEVDANPFKKGADGKYYAPLGTYVPLNNKLMTAPYYGLMCTSSSGESNTFAFEDFDTANNAVVFNMYTCFAPTPTATIAPINYRGVPIAYDDEVDCHDFPQCCYATDSYRAWLAQNGYSLDAAMKAADNSLKAGAVGAIGSGAAGLLGVTLSGGIPGAGLFSSPSGHFGNRRANAGVGQFEALSGGGNPISAIAGAVGGAISTGAGLINNYVNTTEAITARVKDAQKLPDKSRGTAGNYTNYARNAVGFIFYRYYIKEEYARMIDRYFSMYGYKVNTVGIPDIRSRPIWTYVKTTICNFDTSNVPAVADEAIKAIYNKGITFWMVPSQVGHYELAGSNK